MTTPPTDVGAALRDVLPVLARHAADLDREGAFPHAALEVLRTCGLLGLLVPREYGGLGGSPADLVAVAGELAGACLSTALVWAMHCQQSDALVRFASPWLRERVLPRVARGEAYLASVTTEPGKGGHLLTAVAPMRALRHPGAGEDAVLLDRDAPVVTGGLHADGFLITMRSAPDAPDSRVTLLYADRDQLEMVPGEPWDTLGMRGTQSVGLRLSGKVPARQTVGAEGGFRTVALESTAPLGHLAWAACWLGAARSALRDLVGLARSPDRPHGIDLRSELTAERMARIRGDLELVSAYLHRVTQEVVELRREGGTLGSPETQIHLNTLKVTAAELTFRAVDAMVRLAGLRIGYGRHSPVPLERHFRDLRSASLTYADDRLLVATGALTLLDRAVRLA
ncbi:acyl-CoA dehydrogenase family protein [Streptomyces microflavus]|uniref:acyl-CoA dehydrogenase family protein n=1 Tax=Streptomyces microflavus TaxID=1919 RepID=UPI003800E6EA